jgi:hypothetical protein
MFDCWVANLTGVEHREIPYVAFANILTVTFPPFGGRILTTPPHFFFPDLSKVTNGNVRAQDSITNFFVFKVTGLRHDDDIGFDGGSHPSQDFSLLSTLQVWFSSLPGDQWAVKNQITLHQPGVSSHYFIPDLRHLLSQDRGARA